MPLIATRGAASAQGFGEFAQSSVNYIEDVFSTWLYTGNGSTQTITNGVDLSTYGGLVWCKDRNSGAMGHHLVDTARGASKDLQSQSTNGQVTTNTVTAFNSNGFALGTSTDVNTNGTLYTSWTFRKQAKFFDVVTYTGNGASNRGIPHNLGSTPGFILVKATSTTGDWYALHRVGNSGSWGVGTLNSTGTFSAPSPSFWGNGTTFTAPTSTTFTVSADGGGLTNGSGVSFVAYLFAHDAGGFGAAGTDNVITCGSYTGNGSATGPVVTLGYEPQWVMIKNASGVGNWAIVDAMRGFTVGGTDAMLYANTSGITDDGTTIYPTATGFGLETTNSGWNTLNSTYIYIAIRRGPMRTPTSGTSVFSPTLATFSGTTVTNTGFVVDMVINKTGVASTSSNFVLDRLRGSNNGAAQQTISTNATSAEVASSGRVAFTGSVTIQNGFLEQDITANNIVWAFRRAPGFFDVVCYTGVGASATLNHNLGVVPEMVIVKGRTVISNWETYLSVLGGTAGNALAVNSTAAKSGTPPVSSATTTTFTLNNGVSTSNGQTYVAYLFATLAGVSKVGSYAGSGILQTIPCGFASGARFVLIKRTDATGDWYVWDSARGITSGNDPYLFLNSNAVEVTNTNYVDTASTGFQVTAAAPAGLNAVGGNYIFLAIA